MLPLLVAVCLALTWLVSLAATQVRTVDAAREVARASARGDSPASAEATGRRVAPAGAHIEISINAEEVIVRVESTVRGPGGLLAFLPSPQLAAEAVAAREDR